MCLSHNSLQFSSTKYCAVLFFPVAPLCCYESDVVHEDSKARNNAVFVVCNNNKNSEQNRTHVNFVERMERNRFGSCAVLVTIRDHREQCKHITKFAHVLFSYRNTHTHTHAWLMFLHSSLACYNFTGIIASAAAAAATATTDSIDNDNLQRLETNKKAFTFRL